MLFLWWAAAERPHCCTIWLRTAPARAGGYWPLPPPHIMQPPGGVLAQTDAELFRLWKCGSYAVAGTAAHGGKLTAPPQAQLERWMTLADIVLIEADGAKRMPCKAPAAHEPVLLPQCDTVLAVAGLSALRHPLREVCFRAELAAELLLCSAGCAVDTGTSGKSACK